MSGTLTELMSTVHTATSAAAHGRRMNARNSREDCSDLTSGIFSGASVYWNGVGGERAHTISIRLQVRCALQRCEHQGATRRLVAVSEFGVHILRNRYASFLEGTLDEADYGKPLDGILIPCPRKRTDFCFAFYF